MSLEVKEMKKFGITILLLYAVYALAMYVYLFHGSGGGVPPALKGTVADPATFMTERELLLSGEYSQIRNYLYFLTVPLEWIVYLLILMTGCSKIFQKWSTYKFKLLTNSIYLFLLSILTMVIFFPLRYVRFTLSKEYGISTQSFSSWMRDNIVDFWVNLLITIIVVSVLYWLINKTKKWWLYSWFLLIPFSIFIMFVQPVIIDPLYNDFYPLQNKQLEEKILTFAKEASIPADHVYEVNMSDKTNALNAYVTGVGSNARIVLWDTTLNQLTEDEVLFIMAHEMAHYVEKHIYFGIAGYLLLMFIGLWIMSKLFPWFVDKFGGAMKVTSIKEIHSLPLLLLISSVLLFFASPLENYISRTMEIRADEYAIELTDNPEAAISAFQKLSKAGLSESNPQLIVKLFRYTHPPMLDRINKLAEYEHEKTDS